MNIASVVETARPILRFLAPKVKTNYLRALTNFFRKVLQPDSTLSVPAHPACFIDSLADCRMQRIRTNPAHLLAMKPKRGYDIITSSECQKFVSL